MARKKWWKILITVLTFGAKKFEDGTFGAGRKTAQAGKVAGDILDVAGKVIAEPEDKKPEQLDSR
ncbi:MAG: hypothetical protein AAB538_05895 [Patescibacteria group bacterium]